MIPPVHGRREGRTSAESMQRRNFLIKFDDCRVVSLCLLTHLYFVGIIAGTISVWFVRGARRRIHLQEVKIKSIDYLREGNSRPNPLTGVRELIKG